MQGSPTLRACRVSVGFKLHKEIIMSNRMWFEEEDTIEQDEQYEDIANISDDTKEQLWGHTE